MNFFYMCNLKCAVSSVLRRDVSSVKIQTSCVQFLFPNAKFRLSLLFAFISSIFFRFSHMVEAATQATKTSDAGKYMDESRVICHYLTSSNYNALMTFSMNLEVWGFEMPSFESANTSICKDTCLWMTRSHRWSRWIWFCRLTWHIQMTAVRISVY